MLVILDLETAHSPDTLPTGWTNKAALGLSVGGLYASPHGPITWFDRHTLLATTRTLVETAPLLVSFNGIAFDFPLMRALIRSEAETLADGEERRRRQALCDQFKAQVADSCDLLRLVWDAGGRGTPGTSTLAALCAANGLGAKTGDSALVPGLWQAGRVAEVVNHCQHDLLLTAALLTHLGQTGGWLWRGGERLRVRLPAAVRAAVG